MTNFFVIIWTIWAFLITLLIFLVLFPINLFFIFCLGSVGNKIFMNYMYYVANILLFLYGMRKDISGTYPFTHHGPCVYVVNHKSYLDVVIIASIVNPRIKYLGKAEVFKWTFPKRKILSNWWYKWKKLLWLDYRKKCHLRWR